jgi:deazaflavin-dependent oxidoreductase (nitroreductase family)
VGEPAHRGRAAHPVRRRQGERHRPQQRATGHRRILRTEDDHRLQGQGARLSRALPPEIDDDDFCYLTTRGRVTGRPHEIEIWFARHDATLYLLAGGGARSDWVRNLRADPNARVRIGDGTYDARGRLIDDPAEEQLARDLVFAKYQARYGGDLTDWRGYALPVALDVELTS